MIERHTGACEKTTKCQKPFSTSRRPPDLPNFNVVFAWRLFCKNCCLFHYNRDARDEATLKSEGQGGTTCCGEGFSTHGCFLPHALAGQQVALVYNLLNPASCSSAATCWIQQVGCLRQLEGGSIRCNLPFAYTGGEYPSNHCPWLVQVFGVF